MTSPVSRPEQWTLLDMFSMVPQVLISVMGTWDLDGNDHSLATEDHHSTGVGTLRLICKQASRDMLQAVHGLRLIVSAEPSQFQPMLRMAQLLRSSHLKRVRVHIVYPLGKWV